MPRGFLSLSMLSRCTHLGIVRAAPPCTSGSANDRRRTRVIAMLRQGIGTSRKISMHALKFSPDVSTPNTIGNISPNSAEQSANIRRSTPRVKMSQTHRRHIGDTTRRCPWKHRRCIFDVIISPMVWWSIADPSPMFPSCSAKHRRCYGDASLSVRNLPSDWSPRITWALL